MKNEIKSYIKKIVAENHSNLLISEHEYIFNSGMNPIKELDFKIYVIEPEEVKKLINLITNFKNKTWKNSTLTIAYTEPYIFLSFTE